MDEVDLPDELMDEHDQWHDKPVNRNRTTRIEGSRIGNAGDRGSGIDFLAFHRRFINKVVNWYLEENGNLPYWWRGWNALPESLQVGSIDPNDSFPWTSYTAAEQRIVNNPLSFLSADDLGIFIETGRSSNGDWLSQPSIHDFVHMKSYWVYGDEMMPNISMSPRSPLFYQFHGLISKWWDRWRNATYAWPPPLPCDRFRREIAGLRSDIATAQDELQTAPTNMKGFITARIRQAMSQLTQRLRDLDNCMKRGDVPPDLNVQTFQPALKSLTEQTARLQSDRKFADKLFAAFTTNDEKTVESLCLETGAQVIFQAREQGVMLVPPARHVCILIEGHIVAFPIDVNRTVGSDRGRNLLTESSDGSSSRSQKTKTKSKSLAMKSKANGSPSLTIRGEDI